MLLYLSSYVTIRNFRLKIANRYKASCVEFYMVNTTDSPHSNAALWRFCSAEFKVPQ